MSFGRLPHIAVTLAALAAFVFAAAADSRTVAPAYVYAMGGKFDRSFSEALYRGAERFKAATGIPYVDFEVSHETQFEQAYRHFASHGNNPIIGVGFSQTDAVKRIAKAFPKTKFVLLDGNINMPNVLSVEFKEEEGSFLVGVLAAMASKTHKIGFVGGMDIPLIRRFACGYGQGIKYADPKAVMFKNMAGATPDAWTNPARGGEIAREQFDRGVDVVYAAAGSTGIGVLQAAADRGKLAIGVDSNQNYMHPGAMLTSMVKRVDTVAFEAAMAALKGNWKPGHIKLGLKEGGVDWAYDKYNAALITPAMKAAVEKAKADIIAGRIKVHDYESDGSCAY
jgi:basic membrane protein A and related proteins